MLTTRPLRNLIVPALLIGHGLFLSDRSARADDSVWMTRELPSGADRPPDRPNLWLFDMPAPSAENDVRLPGIPPQAIASGLGPGTSPWLVPPGNGDGVGIQQQGSGRTLGGTETGEANLLRVLQQGDGQRGVASQTGTLNVMTLHQTGRDQAITAVQSGTMNGIDALQTGTGNRLIIMQR